MTVWYKRVVLSIYSTIQGGIIYVQCRPRLLYIICVQKHNAGDTNWILPTNQGNAPKY